MEKFIIGEENYFTRENFGVYRSFEGSRARIKEYMGVPPGHHPAIRVCDVISCDYSLGVIRGSSLNLARARRTHLLPVTSKKKVAKL